MASIDYDGSEYVQSNNILKHVKIAEELIKKGFAYEYCARRRNK